MRIAYPWISFFFF